MERNRSMQPPPVLDNSVEHEAMRAMFMARKDVFIDLLGWDLPVLEGRYELDQFDGPEAEYIILSEPDGAHRASARLLPTDRDHLLSTCFPMLCAQTIPSGPTVREITRFCLDRRQRAPERRRARNQLVTALVEYALTQGITDYTGVAEPAWFKQIMAFGWDCRPLGSAMLVGNQRLVGLRIAIDEDTLPALRRHGIFEISRFQMSGGQIVEGHA
jgi:N-acyl-L-homoserine lactone synthetase